MKNKSVLIVGCGDLGARAGAILQEAGWTLTGLRRNTRHLPQGFAGIAADYAATDAQLSMLEALAPDYLILTLKPSGSGEEGYRAGFSRAMHNVLTGLGEHRPAGIIMVSSTRVYAESEGGWVEDGSPLATSDPAALAIIDAERQLLASGHPACVLRCAGIYGDPEGYLLHRIAGGELCSQTPLRYSNRIHRDDVGGLLAWLLQQWDRGVAPARTMIAVDNEPAPQFEVELWLARELGFTGWRTRRATDMRAGGLRGGGLRGSGLRGADHKRCRNRALQTSGYVLRYPDYRSGYAAVLRDRPQTR
ncbi:epimerase [Haliea sp. E1-2-M8]|uniref:epimerase n=1 Tax=Haliea sp. E1-2-M8 TaxID=3064706 RepID=UPI00271E35FC|nr:epimerase [Haliea sp. E1-2-M8]MDO8860162.1 epimerase [Haliea sp. E1-2-M8]